MTNCGAGEHENLRDVKMAEDSKISGQRLIYSLLESRSHNTMRCCTHTGWLFRSPKLCNIRKIKQ
jgi:hypothetical protein